MSAAYSDRNLLFGVLALQMDFLDRDALIAAMHAWIHDKTKSLGDILVEQKILRPDERDALDLLVQKHLDRHRGDVEKSLAAVAISTPLREELHNLADPDVQASVAHLPATSEADEAGPLPSTVSVAKPAGGLRYLVLRPHDKGGIGEVFVALDQELNRQVALKEIQERHAADAHSRGRFVREAEITGGLEHPGIVPVYGLGQYADGRPFYAMRFIQGETLKDAIARYHRTSTDGSGARSPEFEFRSLLTRFVAVCNTIAYAHSRGVIHRDLKPSNIMLGKYGETLVVDWGMAKAGMNEPARSASDGLPEPTLVPSLTDAIETQAGAAMGTPAYMSPEQASGRLDLLGPTSDIYSLGATLYTVLTGCPPIEGKDTAEILRKAQRGEWLPLRQVKPEVSPALDAICRKAMALMPSERYTTALELAADIESLAADVELWQSNEPVGANRESLAAFFRRWVFHHRPLVGITLGVLVVGLLSTTVGSVLISDAVFIRAARDKEMTARMKAEDNEREARAARDWEALARKQAEDNEREASVARDREAEARKKAEDKEREAHRQKEEAHRIFKVARFNQYAAEMNLVQLEYEANNIGHVWELLDSQLPHGGDANDSRNFEWYYWQRMSDRELLTLKEQIVVKCVSFSPDGRRLASTRWDQTVHVWDAASGQELLTLKGGASSVSFSPDGRRLASAGLDAAVRVWDADTGKEQLTLRGQNGPTNSVSFSPDGRCLASAGLDATVRVWDAATGEEQLTLKGHTRPVVNIAFSPDGRRLASASDDQTVRLWDAATGKELLALKGHGAKVNSVAFSPDGRRLASASDDQTVRLWDAATRKELLVLKGHDAKVNSVAFSPDGRRLASASGTTVRVWDATTAKELHTFRGQIATVNSVSFSPDGQRLASGDNTVRIWDATTEMEQLTLKGHASEVNGVLFSPDGRRLASAGEDQTVRIWDAATGKAILALKGHTRPVMGIAFGPDGRRLASASDDQTVRLWDAATGKELLVLKGHDAKVNSVAFSPDGRRLASAGFDRTVRVWDTATGKELLSLQGDFGNVHGVAFSPGGRLLASAGPFDALCVWDAATGRGLLALDGHVGQVFGVSFSPDGRRLVSAGFDKTVRVWDASTGKELLTLKGHKNGVHSVSFSPDGRRLASAGFDGTVRVWDAAAGRQLLTLKGHSARVNSVAFSPDGRRLVSASGDGTVRVWETSRVSDEVRRRRWLVNHVHSLFEELLLRQEVLTYLRKEAALNEADREFALQSTQTHPENSTNLHSAAWNVVKAREAGQDAYALALRQAEAAVRLAPQNALSLITLGAAHYRAGRFSDALATLRKSENLNTLNGGSLPADLAFLAMTQHQLGKKDEAKATLDRLREVMKQPRWARDPDAVGFLREAEELIEGEAAGKGP